MAKTKPNKAREVSYDILEQGIKKVSEDTSSFELSGIVVNGILGKTKDGLILSITEDGEEKHVAVKATIKKTLIDGGDIEERTNYEAQLAKYDDSKTTTTTTSAGKGKSKDKTVVEESEVDYEKVLNDNTKEVADGASVDFNDLAGELFGDN